MYICNLSDVVLRVVVEGSIIATEDCRFTVKVVVTKDEMNESACLLVKHIKAEIGKRYNLSMYRVANIYWDFKDSDGNEHFFDIMEEDGAEEELNDVMEELDTIHSLIKTDIHEADKRVDALYEKYTSDEVQMSENEADYMYSLISVIAHKLYH